MCRNSLSRTTRYVSVIKNSRTSISKLIAITSEGGQQSASYWGGRGVDLAIYDQITLTGP